MSPDCTKDLIKRMQGYFRSIDLESIAPALKGIDDSKVPDLWDALKKMNATWTLRGQDVTREAAKCGAIGGGDHYQAQVQPWDCMVCGFKFSYHMAPTDWQQIRDGVFNFCPKCGFVQMVRDVCDERSKTITYRQATKLYKESNTKAYQDYKAECESRGKNPNYMFYDDKKRAMDKKILIDSMNKDLTG